MSEFEIMDESLVPKGWAGIKYLPLLSKITVLPRGQAFKVSEDVINKLGLSMAGLYDFVRRMVRDGLLPESFFACKRMDANNPEKLAIYIINSVVDHARFAHQTPP